MSYFCFTILLFKRDKPIVHSGLKQIWYPSIFKMKKLMVPTGMLASMFILLFACICLTNSLQWKHIHYQTCHTVKDELDACHRTIYHKDILSGCHHRQHFMAPSCTCDLTKGFYHQDQLAPPALSYFINTTVKLRKLITHISSPCQILSGLNSGRAPPESV